MNRKKLVLVGLLAIFCVCPAAVAEEAGTEEITLTTYYPAPYGEYDELTTSTLQVDGLATLGWLTAGTRPVASSSNEGAVYYDTDAKTIMFSNGSGWVSMGVGNISSSIAIRTGVVNNGATIPLPVFSDSTIAEQRECVWMVSENRQDHAWAAEACRFHCAAPRSANRVVTVWKEFTDGAGYDSDGEANYIIIGIKGADFA